MRERSSRHLANAIAQDRAPAWKSVVWCPGEGIIRNHRHDEPLFVLSMVARALGMVAGVGYAAIAGAPFSHWSSRIREAEPGFWPTVTQAPGRRLTSGF
jgi:hypothetical protein